MYLSSGRDAPCANSSRDTEEDRNSCSPRKSKDDVGISLTRPHVENVVSRAIASRCRATNT